MMFTTVSPLDIEIFDAYQRLKKARAGHDHAAIFEWTTRVDQLLDHREPLSNNGAAGPGWLDRR
jgi:hypothetical protein